MPERPAPLLASLMFVAAVLVGTFATVVLGVLGVVAPLGGGAFTAGWLALAVALGRLSKAAARQKRRSTYERYGAAPPSRRPRRTES